MTLLSVQSIDDPRLAPYRELSQKNLTRQSGLFVAEGDKVVDRLIDSQFEVASVLAEPAHAERLASRVPGETPIYVASRPLLEATIGFTFHRGVLACGRRRPGLPLTEVVQAIQGSATFVVCPDVQDPTNLGSLIRTAAALGASAIILGDRCADPFSRRVLRVSMGAVLHVPLIESANLADDLRQLADLSFDLVATTLDPAAEPLAEAKGALRMAILFGSEGHGLSEECIALCQRQVTIPMQLGIDSLNVAVAAAIVLYHFSDAGQASRLPGR